MSASLNKHELFAEVKKLPMQDQLSFLHKLQHYFEKTSSPQKPSFWLTSLSGLGSEIWKDTDIDKYLDDERQW